MMRYGKTNEEGDLMETFRLNKMIKYLDDKKSYGTSLISISVGCKDQLIQIRKNLTEEEGKARSIKTRITTQNVQEALISVGEMFKLYNKTPQNGLMVFCGVTETEEKVKL